MNCLKRKGGDKMYRLANNRFEVDLLPPYGKPEVSIFGEAATYAAIIFACGFILSKALE